ncbi:reverse transcriptase domain-containing protein [Tanacetum coccineum]
MQYISVGAAHAISYIHYDETRDFSVIHQNISSYTVRLNNDFEPKLSEFHHSLKIKASERHNSFHTDSVWSRKGYTDPTCLETNIEGHKSDIYSFGIVLFELLCGRKSVSDDQDNKYLAPVAIFHYREKTLDGIIDPDLWKQMDPRSLNMFTEIAYDCLNEKRSQRPNVDEIVTRLEKALELQLERENDELSVVVTEVEGTSSSQEEGSASHFTSTGVESNSSKKTMSSIKYLSHSQLSFEDIESATNNFAPENIIITEGSTVILRNAKIDMYKGSMRLAVDRWGLVQSTESADFSANVDCNLSLIEFELITSREVFIMVIRSFNEFTWYKKEALYTRIAAYSDQTRPNLTFVSTSWRHPCDPTLGITLIRMSAMANATLIVTTVTKNSNNEKALDAASRVNILDFCEEHYEDILLIIMEKARHDKRKEVQIRLNFGENPKKTRRERENSLNSMAENSPTRFHPGISQTRGREKRDDRNVFNRLSHQRKSVHERLSDTYSPSAIKSGPSRTDSRDPSHSRGHSLSREHPRIKDRFRGVEESYGDTYSRGTRTKYRDRSRDEDRFRNVKRWKESESPSSESSTSNGGHWKSRTKRCKLVDEDDLAVPWTCEDVDPFLTRIRNFKSSRKTRMPNNVKTYDGTGDPEDHLKIFQAAFDELPQESIDGYKGLKAAFLAYFMQQKKYVKDPVKIHNIKQRDGDTIEDFMERFKVETGRIKGAPECMRISGFMHGVNNPELTKRLNEHVPKTIEEMMTVTTAFIRGEAVTASKKKGHLPWKSQDQSKRHTSERRSDFRGQSREGRGSNKFTPITRMPKEILAAKAGKFKPPPPMLKKQIEELVRAGKLSHLIKEIKQGRDQTNNKKKEAPAKDKSLAIYMIQPWQRMTSDGTEGPLVIEAEIGGHMIHRMYIDGGSSTEVLYEHCFNLLRPEIKNQMVPATTSLTGFSRETIWPLGQLRLLVTIGDADHSTKAWMNFMIVRSLSLYNGIIGRSGIREIQSVPSTAHEMLKFPANGGIVTIRSTILIPAECTTVITSSKEVPKEAKVRPKNFKIALHLNFLDQEVAIRGTLSVEGRTELCSLLKKNLDMFACQPSDMTGVPRSVAEHRLNIREGYSPIRQKKMGQAPEHTKAIQAEVLFSDDFRRSFGKLMGSRLKKQVLNLLLKLSSGWRPKNRSTDFCCKSSSQILKQFKVEGFYVICTNDIIKEVKYVQVLKVWDVLALDEIPKLTKRLESIFSAYTDAYISRQDTYQNRRPTRRCGKLEKDGDKAMNEENERRLRMHVKIVKIFAQANQEP